MISGQFKFDSVFHPGYCYLHLEDCDGGYILGMFHSACIRKGDDDVVRDRLDADMSSDEEDELDDDSPSRVFPSRVRSRPSLFSNSCHSTGNVRRNIRELVEASSESEEEEIVDNSVLITQEDAQEDDVVLPVEEDMSDDDSSDDDSVEVLDLNTLGRSARDRIFLPKDSKRRMLTQLEFNQLPDSDHESFYCIVCVSTYQNHTTKQMSACDATHLFCMSCSLKHAQSSNKCAFCREHFFGYKDPSNNN